jgi:hypothetical protein
MSFRLNILLFCLALFIAGGELAWQSQSMDRWKDEGQAQALQTWDPPMETHGRAYDAYNKRWSIAMDAQRTDKWPYHDAGAALMAFAVCLAASLFLLRIKTLAHVARLASPRSAWRIYFLAMLGWFGYAASAILALLEGFDRFEFPPWSGSLMVPIVAIFAFALTGWVVMSVVMWLVLRGAPLPASLWIWRRDMPMHDWLYTLATGFALTLAAEIMRETYLYGHWSAVPTVFLCVYAALSVRAAGIARAAAG